jgi:ParB family transcriptional regulator, chromosome partitioning protein
MALGKSLGNILGDYFGEDTNINLSQTHTVVQEIPLTQIKITEYQMRTHFDDRALQSLAWSIQESGLIHPVLLLKQDNGYTLLSGERRLRAVQKLGLKTVSAIVKEKNSLNDQQQATLTAVENLQREDLSPLEQSRTYKILMDTKKIDEQELAKIFNLSVQHIRNYLRLLNSSPKVQEALQARLITEGQARHIIPLDHDLQEHLLEIIIEKQLTVKEVELMVQRIKHPKPATKTTKSSHKLPENIVSQGERFAKQFKNSKIKYSGDENEGKIIISWKK